MYVITTIQFKFNRERPSRILEIGYELTGYGSIDSSIEKVVIEDETLNTPIVYTQEVSIGTREAFRIVTAPDTLKKDILEFQVADYYTPELVKSFAKRCNKILHQNNWHREFNVTAIFVEEKIVQSNSFTFDQNGEEAAVD